MKVKEMKADPGSGVWLQRKTLKFLEKVTPAKWGRVSNSEERERNSPTCSYLVKKKKKKNICRDARSHGDGSSICSVQK